MRETISYDWCDRDFAREERVPATVTRHVRVDAMSVLVLQLCERCDKELLGDLIAMIKDAPVVDIEPPSTALKCELCGSKFRHRRDLEWHIWSSAHIGEPVPSQELTCPECGREFARAQDTKRHLGAAHGRDWIEAAYMRAREIAIGDSAS